MNSKAKGAQIPAFGEWPSVRTEVAGGAFLARLRAATREVDAREVLGGLVLFAFGLFAAVYGQRYSFGTLTRMGPGFFPVCLGVLLCGYGALHTVLAFVQRGAQTSHVPQAAESGDEVPPPEAVEWRNLAAVSLGLILFGVLLSSSGMVVATLVAVGIYTLADRECNVLRSVTLALLITGLTVAVFIWGLQMTVPVWWN